MPAKKAKQDPITTEAKGAVATLTVHKTLYPADVLFGTAFTFLDRCYVHLDQADKDRTQVELTARPGEDIDALVGAFKNELVTQAVRLKLAKQTEKVRTMIVGRAIGESLPTERRTPGAPSGTDTFAPDLPPEVAKILAEEEDSLDFLDDPLGIAVPWEEKHTKGGEKADGAPVDETPKA